MKKRTILSLFYTVILLFIGWGSYVILSIIVNSLLYGYREKTYEHEIDFLFSKDSVYNLVPKYVYKNGKKSGIYFVSRGLSNLIIIESSHYIDIAIDEIRIKGMEEIKSTENKTYSLYYHPPFPVVEQVLHPKKSNHLNIFLNGKYEIENEMRTKGTLYLSGNFNTISFSNTQNCSMVSFTNSQHEEILIVKHNTKLFFLMQTLNDKSVLDLINPLFLAEID